MQPPCSGRLPRPSLPCCFIYRGLIFFPGRLTARSFRDFSLPALLLWWPRFCIPGQLFPLLCSAGLGERPRLGVASFPLSPHLYPHLSPHPFPPPSLQFALEAEERAPTTWHVRDAPRPSLTGAGQSTDLRSDPSCLSFLHLPWVTAEPRHFFRSLCESAAPPGLLKSLEHPSAQRLPGCKPTHWL